MGSQARWDMATIDHDASFYIFLESMTSEVGTS